MVIPPAKTGRDNKRRTAVIKIAQINKGILFKFIVTSLMFTMVTIKFMAPNKEDIPARCKLKIAKSTELPAWAIAELRGGYIVHPVPAPCSTSIDETISVIAGIKSQKEMLFSLG